MGRTQWEAESFWGRHQAQEWAEKEMNRVRGPEITPTEESNTDRDCCFCRRKGWRERQFTRYVHIFHREEEASIFFFYFLFFTGSLCSQSDRLKITAEEILEERSDKHLSGVVLVELILPGGREMDSMISQGPSALSPVTQNSPLEAFTPFSSVLS